MHQESRCNLVGCLWSRASHEAPMKVLAEAAIFSRRKLGKIHFQAHLHDRCQLSDPFPGSDPFWLLHEFISSMPCRLKEQRERKRERTPRWKPETFCYLISAVTAHRFCWILFSRSKSLIPATLEERDLYKGMKTRRWRSLRAILVLLSYILFIKIWRLLSQYWNIHKKSSFTFPN